MEAWMKKKGLALQVKPVGSSCNLLCKYPCYALPFRGKKRVVMSDEVLRRTIQGVCIANQPGSEVTITWHGGEPMLAGIDFYRKALVFFAKYRKEGQILRHKMQTNATLVNDEWANFFVEAGFEIGISLDGPEVIHDINRVTINGKGSFSKAMRGLKILRQAGLDPTVIATITVATLPYVDEVFRFLVDNGFTSIKYSPVFDPNDNAFSINNQQWYEYLSRVFDLWMERGDPDISILDLDEVIAWLNDSNVNMCSSEQTCLGWVTIEPDGRMGPCAYFGSDVPYGNIMNTSLETVPNTPVYRKFLLSFLTPPAKCRNCQFYRQCGNGCPATRLTGNQPDPGGIYVYCNERQKLFEKIKAVNAAEQ